ncbi:MAG: heavy-metal-associated domain-containing protein [Candidatus Nanopelagicaceae bacterium]|nr:heavy-metal-associated domain-containing protein [Candidatus Nanopelagicaceae bacterium]
MSEQNWKATGLTCNHCAQSVTKYLMLIDGMSSVNVEVKPNEISSIQTVGAREFMPEEISRAMTQAGKYVLT